MDLWKLPSGMLKFKGFFLSLEATFMKTHRAVLLSADSTENKTLLAEVRRVCEVRVTQKWHDHHTWPVGDSRRKIYGLTCCSACCSCSRGSAGSSSGTVCNMPWTKPQHLNTVIRARAGYWLNYTWKRRHLREARGLNIMINYGLMRGDKSQLNKNNTGLHAAGEGSVFNAQLHFPFQRKKHVECVYKAPTPRGPLICCSWALNRVPSSGRLPVVLLRSLKSSNLNARSFIFLCIGFQIFRISRQHWKVFYLLSWQIRVFFSPGRVEQSHRTVTTSKLSSFPTRDQWRRRHKTSQKYSLLRQKQ